MIRLDMCAPSVLTGNTSIRDQIICRDMFGFIIWRSTRMMFSSDKCLHRDLKVEIAEEGGGWGVDDDYDR